MRDSCIVDLEQPNGAGTECSIETVYSDKTVAGCVIGMSVNSIITLKIQFEDHRDDAVLGSGLVPTASLDNRRMQGHQRPPPLCLCANWTRARSLPTSEQTGKASAS